MGQDVKIGIGVALCIGLLLFILVVARSGCGPEGPAADQTAEAPAGAAELTEAGWTRLEELELGEPQVSAAEERAAEVEVVGLPAEEPAAEAGWLGEGAPAPLTAEVEELLAEQEGPPVPAVRTVSPPTDRAPFRLAPTATPRGQTYTVQQGDSLWSLAERFYGEGRRWKKIHEANRDVLPSSTNVPVGVVLVIPAVEAPSAGVLPAKLSVEASTVPSPIRPAGATHTVERGQTLYQIALKHYGDGSLWRIIYDANRDRIPAPKRLPVGAVLVIPAAPPPGK